MPVYQLIKGIRKFNGSDISSEQWLTKFEGELAVAALSERWAIQNLDRVLVDKAKSWWAGVSQRHEEGLTDANMVARWVVVKQEMNASFGRNALKEQAKLQAKQLKFNVDGDPQEYVYKKIELLSLINPQMSQEDKLVYLEAGLPRNIARMMSLHYRTTEQFVKRLKKYLRVESSYSSQSKTNSYNSDTKSFHTGNFNPRFNQMNKSNDRSRTNSQTNNRKETRTCFTCNEVGHLSRNCPKKGDVGNNVSGQKNTSNRGNVRKYNGIQVLEEEPAFADANPSSEN